MRMFRVLVGTLSIVAMGVSSCVTNVDSEEAMGVKRGEVVKTVERSKLIYGDISGWTNTWDLWFGSSNDKVELMPLDESAIYGMDVGRIPIGHEVRPCGQIASRNEQIGKLNSKRLVRC